MVDIDEMKIRRLDGTLLLVLRELLRRRKATDVARRLGLSQSAVSHALARLRELFDDPLFVRQPHGLSPTRHALALAPKIDALLEGVSDALGLSTRFDPERSARSFRIGAPEFLVALLAGPLLEDFARNAPGARFAFLPSLGEEALQALRRDEMDLAVGRFARVPDDLAATRLLEDRYCLVARKGHPAVPRKLDRQQLRTLDHVQVSVAGDFQSPLLPELQALGIERRVVASVPRFLNAFLVVASSDAVAIVPRSLAHAHGPALGLRLHDLAVRLRPIRALAVCRAHPDPGTEWLIERVRAVSDAQ